MSDSAHTDVIIIGAGAAGLSAAKALRASGLRIKVVEGSHRIGGRAYSEELAPGVWFDLGCSYLHHGSGNPFGPIADRLGIPLSRAHADMFASENIRAYRNGIELAGEDLARYREHYEDCEAAIEASVARGEDRAIAELIDLESPYLVPYASGMASLNTKDIDEHSAADYADFHAEDVAGTGDIPVPGGYGNLVAAWGADVDVTLNCRVERIDWSGSGVAVDTAKGRLTGRVALITVSTGILAAELIRFAPVLPGWKVEAYRALTPGTANKVGIHFDRDVFGPDGLGFHVAWNDAGDAAGCEASVSGNNTAIVFTGGRLAVWLEKQGPQGARAYALDRIAEVFGSDVRKHALRSIATAWGTEPWTLGAYSAARPGCAHQRKALGQPVGDRLFFAGEATALGEQATCHGAYRSGLRAADEIAALLVDRVPMSN